MFEGSNRHSDLTLCMGLSITDEDIDSLCQSMKEQAVTKMQTMKFRKNL